MNKKSVSLILLVILLVVPGTGLRAAGRYATYELGGLSPADPAAESQVLVHFFDQAVQFRLADERAGYVQLRISDPQGSLVYDSGLSADRLIAWPMVTGEGEPATGDLFIYHLLAWDPEGQPLGGQAGELDLSPAGMADPLAVALSYDVPGNFTIGGYLGIGTESPARAVHIVGSNAVFRMDRSQDSAAFMLVRTDGSGNAQKTFVVGVNSSGTNQGEFVINDLGAAVSGGGSRRLTIDNSGNATFTGTVTAQSFVSSSSARFKEQIATLTDAVALLGQLRGVRFQWKDSGQPAIGLIAEEVARVLPEIVAFDEAGQPVGLDYSKLTAVLVEAAKSQQAAIERLRGECDALKAQWQAELERIQRQ